MAITINILSSFKNTGFQRLEKELSRLETPMQKIQATARALGPAASIGFGALALGATQAIQAAEAAEVADKRLANIAKSMGIFGDETAAVTSRLSAFADQTMKATAIDDEIIKSTQAKLLTFKNLAATADETGGAMDRATLAALDLAAAGFGTAESNAVQLGKALQDPVKGITALARAGVTFTESEKEKIKALVESGDLLSAQNMVLSAIETQVGGTAEATATNSAKMSAAFGELQEKIGAALLPVLEKVTPVIIALVTFMEQNTGVVIALGVVFGTLAASIIAVNIAMMANPISLIIAGVAALTAGIILLVNWLIQLGGGWEKVSAAIGAALDNVVKFFSDTFINISKWFEELPSNVKKFFASAGQWLMDAGKNIIDGLWNGLKSKWDSVITWINNAGQMISDTFKNVLGIKSPSKVFEDHGENIGKGLVKGMEKISPKVKDAAKAMADELNSSFTGNLLQNGSGKVISAWANATGFQYILSNGMSTGQSSITELTSEYLNNELPAGVVLDATSLNAAEAFISKTQQIIDTQGGYLAAFNPAALAQYQADIAKASTLIPKLANGGIVMPQPGGIIAQLAEAGKPEAVIPLDRMGQFGGNQITVNVNAGLGTDGTRIGQLIVEEIKKFERSSGPVFVRA